MEIPSQQDLANAGQHQGRERVVDHRLVVDRQQLLADRPGDRVQACAAAAGQDDPFVEVTDVFHGSFGKGDAS